MKDKQNNLVVIALAIVAGLALIAVIALIFSKVDKEEFAGAFAARGHNNFVTVTQTVTTTQSSGLPVLLFTTNTSRIYALIENDSATDIFIFLRSFAEADAASSTINVNEGIRINANGGSYEILPENMYLGPVWATSTEPGLNILLIEK